MFHNKYSQRGISALLIVTFSSLTMFPFTVMAQAHDAMEKAGYLPKPKEEGFVGNAKRYFNTLAGNAPVKAATAASADERLAGLLGDIHETLKAVTPDTALPREAHLYSKARATPAKSVAKATALTPLPGTDVALQVKNIQSKFSAIKRLYPEVDQSFKDTAAHLKAAKAGPDILKRHQDNVAQFESRKAEFERLMGVLEKAGSKDQPAALADLGRFMAQNPNAKPHQYTDPNKLPFVANSGKVRAPFTTKAAFQTSLFAPQPGKAKLVAKSALPQAAVAGVPDAGDLAETDDVQLTQAIKDQALALKKNPVAIYNWVRNNIEFIPSYGSIQGSDNTLHSRHGNAFDTASLLIALYRASGIPAHYVYGTIDVPADKMMNWVGGVSKTEAAQSLLGQGGIPNVALTAGGAVTAIRMEHVWVEAYVDNLPSGGALNKKPGSWVPMDASFKQYQFSRGIDIKANVPVMSQALVDHLQQGATVNKAEGWVQNINQPNLQADLAAHQAQVKAFIDSKTANATVDDVVGSKKIVSDSHAILLGSLPYKTVSIANTFQAVPDNLRWKFKTNIYAADGVADSDSPLIELNQITAKLAGKKITLSFAPATQADQDLVNSYMPKAHADNSPVQPSEFPKTLPGYLLHMKAEIRVDGQVVAQTTDSFTLGSDLMQSNQYYNPATGSWSGGTDIDITVGEYNAIGMDLQGNTPGKLAQLKAKLAATKARLAQFQQNPADTSPVAGLTKEDISGDLVYAGILSYFAQVDTNDEVISRTSGGVTSYRLPSYGRFFIAAQPHYFFGVVRSVGFPGTVLDVAYLNYHAVANNADQAVSRLFMRQAGAAGSATEHTIPEQLFSNRALPPNDPAQPLAVSAVRALALAAAQGQKIYTLSASNQSLHDTILQSLQIDQDVKSEISNALAGGMEVTVHQQNISLNGWSGSGYLIIDPVTGAGAYKIAGGANGGFVHWVDSNSGLLGLGAWALVFAGGPWVWLAVAIVWAVVAAGIISYLEESDGTCGNGGLALYVALEIFFGIAGYYAEPVLGWVFWLLGFQADGGIRAALTHCNRP